MSLIAKRKTFTPAPEGLWNAVCIDVVDLGIVTSEYQGKKRAMHKCRLVWELEALMVNGMRFLVGKQYTVSLHAKAQLYKDLVAWRGKPFTSEELDGFDIEKVLGIPCRILVVQNEKNGEIYGNVQTIMRADKQTSISPNGTYVRVKDRPVDKQSRMGSTPGFDDSAHPGHLDPPLEDYEESYFSGDDIPF